MKMFEIYRARIPSSMFRDIVEDLDVVMNQYGDPVDHNNEDVLLL